MIHGGSQSGTNFTGTPDGREGWRSSFCVVAMRSTSSISLGVAGRPTRLTLRTNQPPLNLEPLKAIRRAGTLQPLAAGAPPTQWPGRAPRAILSSTVLRLANTFDAELPLQQSLNRDAIVALLEKIGPSILLTHSQSGAFGWPSRIRVRIW